MKCERCGATIKKGETYCSKCGEKTIYNLNDTINIDVLKDKDINKEEEIFYQKGLEKGTNPVNILLVILVILLTLGIMFLVFYQKKELDNSNDENVVLKQEDTQEKEIKERDVYYNNYKLILPIDIKWQYNDDKLFLDSVNYEACIYTMEDTYKNIIDNLETKKNEWKEQSIETISNKELSSGIYEIINSINNKYQIYYLKDIDNQLIIMEIAVDSIDILNNNSNEILGIVQSIEKTDKIISNDFGYFNMNDIEK